MDESLAPGESSAQSSTTAQGTPVPSDGLRGLCNAFEANGEDPAKLTGATSFARLVAAAGSAEAVPAYCRALLGLPPPTTAPATTTTD